MRFLLLSLIFISGILPELYAQDRDITLRNPSFEGIPHIGNVRYANSILGWSDCGLSKFPGESPPDLQPGHFKVKTEPYHGRSYIGLVVRDNETWESVSQSLSAPLKVGKCYNFSLYLAQSENYRSPARKTGISAEESAITGAKLDSIDHVTPCVLRIWGGKSSCQGSKTELLAETPVINHPDWVEYNFKFEPTEEHYFVTLEAYVKTPSIFPYNGHILMDNLSSISPIPCTIPEPEISFENPKANIKVEEAFFEIKASAKNIFSDKNIEFNVNGKNISDFGFAEATGKFYSRIKLREGKNNIKLIGSNESGTVEDAVVIIYEEVEEEEIAVVEESPKVVEAPVVSPSKPLSNTISGLEKKELKEQQTLEIKNLNFEENSFEIGTANFPILDEIYGFLKTNQDVVIEIGGHTNNNCDDVFCKSLSEKRAKAVAEYLENKGVSASQLQYKGYGSEKPRYTNKTPLGKKKNQRVEVKIISMGD